MGVSRGDSPGVEGGNEPPGSEADGHAGGVPEGTGQDGHGRGELLAEPPLRVGQEVQDGADVGCPAHTLVVGERVQVVLDRQQLAERGGPSRGDPVGDRVDLSGHVGGELFVGLEGGLREVRDRIELRARGEHELGLDRIGQPLRHAHLRRNGGALRVVVDGASPNGDRERPEK